MLVAGVDDAGRGPVIGPLMIVGVALPQGKIKDLISIGARDSKMISKTTRERLAAQIKNIASGIAQFEIDPSEIDDVVFKARKLERLNFLEAKYMARAISKLKPNVAYVDASDVLADRFGKTVSNMIPFHVKIVSEHHADRKYPIVSAASILAKVQRDRLIELLKREYGEFGSGYPTDSRTINYLKQWFKKNGSFPPIVRKSWKTVKRLVQEESQSQLDPR